jgi:hypothetical protein
MLACCCSSTHVRPPQWTGMELLLDARQLLVQDLQRSGQLYGSGREGTDPLDQADYPSQASPDDGPLRAVGAELNLGRAKFRFCFLTILLIQREVGQDRQ